MKITDEQRRNIVNSICIGTGCEDDNCPFSRRGRSIFELGGDKEEGFKDLDRCFSSVCSDEYILKAQRWALKHMREKFLRNADNLGYNVNLRNITFI